MAVRRGQSDLEQVFIEHDSLVRRVVGRGVASTALIDDITGEVWVAAAAAYRNGRASDVTTGWLVTVAKRRMVDHWRRASTDRRRFERLVSGASRNSEASCLEVLLAADQSLLDLVSCDGADVLRLRYVEGWCVADIATALDVTYVAAESRLARARASLRTQLIKQSKGSDASHVAAMG